ncbi:Protein kinase C-binding protein NELL1, partial [Fragariocoptes setiger]
EAATATNIVDCPTQDVVSSLETRIVLLERYLQTLTHDLIDVQVRLKEREKCDCQLSCTHNKTRYAIGATWHSQNTCEQCKCQPNGQVICVPMECPAIQCDDPVLVRPGECCPVCLKKCKYNNSILKHGQRMTIISQSGNELRKECLCTDGRIKCDKLSPAAAHHSVTSIAGDVASSNSHNDNVLLTSNSTTMSSPATTTTTATTPTTQTQAPPPTLRRLNNDKH